ncbi:unnamed protein product [Cuscuta europaea]|uniref:Uncharacterized protein n=1 Tax=Cuscuta europaea TaxID=41803 RepID=A0A9P0YYX6_CUSEU|nr:unnamed protein product [Cuscuta europaea]
MPQLHWMFQEQSTKNKENCSKSKEPHCTGTKSFPRLIHEMAEESNGIQPSRAKVYVRTRTRKNGSIVNDNTAEVVEQMKQKMSETTMESEGTSWDNDVYAQVKGPEKRGYVRCMRTKIKRSNSCGSSCTQQRRKNDEVETMKAEICGLKTALNHVLSIMKKRFPEDELSNLIIGQVLIFTIYYSDFTNAHYNSVHTYAYIILKLCFLTS